VTNGWSLVATDYDVLYAGQGSSKISELLPLNLTYQMSPRQAFLMSFGLVALSLLLWSGILLLLSLCGKKLIGLCSVVLVIGAGIGMAALKTKWMWLLPVSHAILFIHYQNYYRKYVLSPLWSVAILLSLVAVVYILIGRKIHSINLDDIWEEQR
jgi:hypothetical protein